MPGGGPVAQNIWRAMTIGERIEHLLGRSLDEAREILDEDHNNPALTPFHQDKLRGAKLHVINTVMRVATKASIESRRLTVAREQVFTSMQRELGDLRDGDGGATANGGNRKPRP